MNSGLGFHRTHACRIRLRTRSYHAIVIIPVDVDDKLLAGNDDDLLNSIQASIGPQDLELQTLEMCLGSLVFESVKTSRPVRSLCQYIKDILARYVIGSLMYVALGTRPDICSVTRARAPFAATFGDEHRRRQTCYARSGCPSRGIMYTMEDGKFPFFPLLRWPKTIVISHAELTLCRGPKCRKNRRDSSPDRSVCAAISP